MNIWLLLMGAGVVLAACLVTGDVVRVVRGAGPPMIRLIESALRQWCYVMHPAPMWPVRGKWRCRRCLREFPVRWR